MKKIEEYFCCVGNATFKMEPFKTYINVDGTDYPLNITQMRVILESVFNDDRQEWTIRELREAIESIK